MSYAPIAACSLPGAIVGVAVGFGVLWLSALRDLHKAETERDRYWDMCHQAGLIIGRALIDEKGRDGQR